MCMEECAELIQAINKKHRGEAHNSAVEIIKAEKLERLCQKVIEKVRGRE